MGVHRKDLWTGCGPIVGAVSKMRAAEAPRPVGGGTVNPRVGLAPPFRQHSWVVAASWNCRLVGI
eukprot:7047185-Pyramimonas_sp.AAC.1